MKRTINFLSVLYRAGAKAGFAAEDLSGGDFPLWRGFVSDALKEGWRAASWPEICAGALVYVRPLYVAATAYAAGDTVWYIDPTLGGKFYQAIRATTGNLPTSTAYWAAAKSSFSATWVNAASAYVAGDQAYDPLTDASWQCHTATTGATIGNVSFWGRLVDFVPVIEQEGTVYDEILGVWTENPDTSNGASEVDYRLNATGIVLKRSIGKVWLTYRLIPPTLTGEVYASGSIYTGGTDQVLYGTSFYDCVTTTTGESPVTTPAKWRLVEIPWFMDRYLVEATYAAWLTQDGQGDKAATQMALAMHYLEVEADILLRQQGQAGRMRVRTR